MGADASIYSLIRTAQQGPSPMEEYGQMMSLKGLLADQDLRALQRQQLERGMAEEQSVKDWYSRLGTANPREKLTDLAAISPKAYRDAAKFYVDQDKTAAETMSKDRENFVALTAEAHKRLPTITTPEQWMAYRDSMIQSAGMFQSPQIRQIAMKAAEALPAQFDPEYIRRSVVKGEELFTPKLVERTDGQRKWMEDTNPFTNPAILRQQPVQMQATPGEVLTDTRTREEGKANRGVTMRGQDMTDKRAKEANDIAGGRNNREDADNLRKEFESKQAVKDYRAAVPVAEAARSAPDTRAGDIQLAYAVGKVLDPNSVVREGELKLVGDAATVMQNIEGQLRTLTAGKGRLTPETRAQLQTMLDNALTQRRAAYDAERKGVEGIVQRRGYNAQDVFMGTPPSQSGNPPATPKPAPVVDSLPDPAKNIGKVARNPQTGKVEYRSDGTRWVKVN